MALRPAPNAQSADPVSPASKSARHEVLARSQSPETTGIPEGRRYFGVFFITLHLVNLAPSILIDGGIQPMNLVIATASVNVVVLLSGLERFWRLRERRGLQASLVTSAALAIACGALSGAACLEIAKRSGWAALTMDSQLSRHHVAAGALSGSANGLFVFVVWTLAVVMPRAAAQDRRRREEIATLKIQAQQLRSEAELLRLRGQLEPHFLLNSLNMVAGLVGSDVERARLLLAALGELLRDALSQQADIHTIAEEMLWLQRYVAVMVARHGDLLRVTWSVDARARQALVPRLILQPLVENAIRHGALRRAGGGSIEVRVERLRDVLVCEVRDDGPGLGTARQGSIGIENVRRRIALHAPDGTLALESGGAGTRAVVRVPFSVSHDSLSDS